MPRERASGSAVTDGIVDCAADVVLVVETVEIEVKVKVGVCVVGRPLVAKRTEEEKEKEDTSCDEEDDCDDEDSDEENEDEEDCNTPVRPPGTPVATMRARTSASEVQAKAYM